MKLNQRWLILGGLLLATLLAGYLAEDEPAPEKSKPKKGAVAKSVATTSAGESRRAGAKDKAVELVAAAPLNFPEPPTVEAAAEGELINPFRTKSWYVAPPPPPPPPPPKPTPPPLPFQFLGKVSEDGVTRVFLNHQGQHLVAKVGDVINGTYTVEEIGGGRMTFLYQPLQEKQVLAIGPDK